MVSTKRRGLDSCFGYVFAADPPLRDQEGRPSAGCRRQRLKFRSSLSIVNVKESLSFSHNGSYRGMHIFYRPPGDKSCDLS